MPYIPNFSFTTKKNELDFQYFYTAILIKKSHNGNLSYKGILSPFPPPSYPALAGGA